MKTKIALITGGSRGLGKDMALSMAQKGLDVIITYNSNKHAADEVVSEIEMAGQKAKAFQLDTSNTKTFSTFFEKVSGYLTNVYGSSNFDYLVNNAGTGLYQLITDTTEEDLDEMYNIHVKGTYFLTQRALVFMNDGGGIVNISSGLTRFTFPKSSAYASMKGAVEVFTRYLAKELGARGIRANTVAPGAIATEFGGGDTKNNEQKRNLLSSVTALGRVGEPDDIGSVVAFLCTDDAKWINGQRIEVSGGVLL